MEGYAISLALFDYLPVLAGGIALYLVCRYCAGLALDAGAWVALIPLIAVTGGAFKATWKLVLATRGLDLQWMEQSVNLVGNCLLAAGAWRMMRRPASHA